MPIVKAHELTGSGDVPGTAAIFMDVLNGKGTSAQNSVVIANASLALSTYFPGKEIEECLEAAKSSLLGGKALNVFTKLISLQ
jgi:anthranilate phosphoribosyltransferase